jgi:sphinganine-1-phosphate aldolase
MDDGKEQRISSPDQTACHQRHCTEGDCKNGLFASFFPLSVKSCYEIPDFSHTNQVDSLNADMRKPFAGEEFRKSLPDTGLDPEKVIHLMNHYQNLSSVQWRSGRVSGGVYAAMSDKKLQSLMKDVYGETAYTNPLHADIFPGVRKMESEVVRMCVNLFHGDENCCGTMTTGGTESLVMACKAYRDYARAVRGVENGEIIAPTTAHAGFDKAAQLLGLKLRHVDVDPKTFKVSVSGMKRLINRNTVMLVGSSPSYPHGIIDPIDEIAKLGLAYGIPVHVDACLGGFLLPFMADAGYPVPVNDFSVPGVTSISADTHKYGYAPKGSSVILYRNPEFRHHQYSVCTEWPGGMYCSPTISGSRAGANIATCWAALLYHGKEGYVNSTRLTIQVTRFLKEEARTIPGIHLLGDPLMSVLAFGSNHFNILDMSERLTHRGWNLNSLQVFVVLKHLL